MSDKSRMVIQGGYISVGDIIQGDHNTITKGPGARSAPKKMPKPMSASATDRSGIVLCYNRAELEAMRSLRERLAASGIEVWVDETAVDPGAQWQDELSKALGTAACGLVLIGEEGLGPWQIMEIKTLLSRMLEHECIIIPVLLPNAEAQQLPMFLQQLNYIDLRADYSAALRRLINRLKDIRR